MKRKLPQLQNLPLGKVGEEHVRNYLTSKGYKIVDQNVYLFHGELDLVALKDNITIFIEVKTRTSNLYGDPIEAVTRKKLQVLIRTSQLYMQKHTHLPQQMRLDVISLIVDHNFEIKSLRHDIDVTGNL